MKELNATGANPNDLSTRFVYIKGDGTVYASDVNLNAIGKYLYTSEPAVTTGSHFAWKVENRKDNQLFLSIRLQVKSFRRSEREDSIAGSH